MTTLTRPLACVADALRRVRGGDLDVRVRVGATDEVGYASVEGRDVRWEPSGGLVEDAVSGRWVLVAINEVRRG